MELVSLGFMRLPWIFLNRKKCQRFQNYVVSFDTMLTPIVRREENLEIYLPLNSLVVAARRCEVTKSILSQTPTTSKAE